MSINQLKKRSAMIPFRPAAVEQDAAAQVAGAENGDNQAFEILVRRYQAKILRVVMRFTRKREDAEDLLQQSFQKAFIHLRRFKGISSFSTWLRRIAINEALMWLRSKRASREVSIDGSGTRDEPVMPMDFPDPAPNPEDFCLGQERKRVLFQAMNKLAPPMRAAVELRELEELSTHDTAAPMGLSVAAVKARVFHGRKKLCAICSSISSERNSTKTRRGDRAMRRAVLRASHFSAADVIRARPGTGMLTGRAGETNHSRIELNDSRAPDSTGTKLQGGTEVMKSRNMLVNLAGASKAASRIVFVSDIEEKKRSRSVPTSEEIR